MVQALPRRKRRLLLTAGLALAFVLAGAAVVFLALKPEPEYRPGEKVEGLTAELTRSLPTDYPRVTFADVTRQAGIDFWHFWETRTSQLPEDMGSGAAWGDYDNDGWLDLFVANLAGPITLPQEKVASSPATSALYRNNRDGTFTNVTVRAGVSSRGWGMGAAWGDYDNDGWPDLFLTSYGENVLYHNDGNGRFSDRTLQARVGGIKGFWAGAAWGDYDRDGLLDLYVTGYVKYSASPDVMRSAIYDAENPASINPNSFPPERNLLYRNNGDGTFSEVARRAGVLGDQGKSLGAAWSDLDEDGWPDLYVANDVSDNLLFRNLGNGTFEDISHPAMVADYRSAMGLALGDWDGDQDTDIFITHWIAQENALYNNQRDRLSGAGPLRFMDEADRYGVGQIALDYVGWGTFFFDYDNDGKLDLFVANGHTFQQRDAPQLLAPQLSQLFWNRGAAQGFYDVSAVSGEYFRKAYVGRGAAFGDYDNDGDLDVFVVNHSGPGVLLRNEGGNRNCWLQVRLEGRKSNHMALGAKLRLVVGTTVHVREVGSQASYLSQNTLIEHFGLGANTEADSLVVVWPSGARQVLTRIAANQVVRVVEGEDVGSQPREARIREFWGVYRQATQLRVAGNPSGAAQAYARALELDPQHEDALYYLGNMYVQLSRYREAESAWQRLTEVNPRSSRAHARLGDLHLCLEPGAPVDLARAEEAYRRALDINREETGPLLRLGEIALVRGDLVEARRFLDAVIGANPGSVPAYLLKGYLAWRNGDLNQASALFAKAVELAQPPEPAGAPPAEGDTKRGLAPLVASQMKCGPFQPDIAGPLSGAGPALRARMTDQFRRLAQTFEELGRRRP